MKQPTSLRAMAMDLLVDTILRLCTKLSEDMGPGEEFLREISAIREEVCKYVPRNFLGEFISAVIDKFHRRANRTYAHYGVTELMMDVEIIGLRSGLAFTHDEDVHRIRGLVELNPNEDVFLPHEALENCCLSYLRVLVLSRKCFTDHHLTVIGKNCPRLQSLNMSGSSVTDEGLRALSPCRDLRVVDIRGCEQVSHLGMNNLICEHAKLEDFSCGSWIESERKYSDGCNSMSRLDRPCLSMKRFCVFTDVVTNTHLGHVVEKFPNLTRFETRFESLGDISILKSLNNLEGISLECTSDYSNQEVGRVWRSLEELFSFIGENITSLELSYYLGERCVSDPGNLNYILKACPNIEYLTCYRGFYDLVIPSLKKLRGLSLYTTWRSIDNDSSTISFDLEKSGTMYNLESLKLSGFEVSFETVKSIMLDNIKFPKLTKLETFGMTYDEYDEIIQIIKNNNLQFLWNGDVFFSGTEQL